MNMMDTLLKQAASMLGPELGNHFDAAVQSTSSEALGQSLASMFRSTETAPFASQVSQLFSQSNADQRAGLLNQLLAAAGPALLSSSAGGVLGSLMSPGASQLTAEQAGHLSVTQVEQIAGQAERANPGVVDKVGHFYAQHATLIKTLGGAALTVALAQLREYQQA